jgi:predicted RNA methylase
MPILQVSPLPRNSFSYPLAHMIYTAATTYDDIREKIIADLGCGCGMLSIAAAMMGARKVLAIDIDKDALAICRRNLQDLGIIDLESDGEEDDFEKGPEDFEIESDFAGQSESEDRSFSDDNENQSDLEAGSTASDDEADQSEFEAESDLVETFLGDVTDMLALQKVFESKNISTVILNPPFGTKNNSGIDVAFLEAALSLAQTNPLRAIYSMHKSTTRPHLQRKADDWKCNLTVVAEMKFDLPPKYDFHKRENVTVAVDLLRFELRT